MWFGCPGNVGQPTVDPQELELKKDNTLSYTHSVKGQEGPQRENKTGVHVCMYKSRERAKTFIDVTLEIPFPPVVYAR